MIFLQISHAKSTGDKIFAAWQSLTIETTQAKGNKAMQEKVTGLDWKDFVNLNTALDALQGEYQKMSEQKFSSFPDFWVECVEEIKETRKKLNGNRSIER
jgi:hypothetical protein